MKNKLMNYSGLNVMSRKELQQVFAGTQPDCEDGLARDEDGTCRTKVEQGGGYDNSTNRCDRA